MTGLLQRLAATGKAAPGAAAAATHRLPFAGVTSSLSGAALLAPGTPPPRTATHAGRRHPPLSRIRPVPAPPVGTKLHPRQHGDRSAAAGQHSRTGRQSTVAAAPPIRLAASVATAALAQLRHHATPPTPAVCCHGKCPDTMGRTWRHADSPPLLPLNADRNTAKYTGRILPATGQGSAPGSCCTTCTAGCVRRPMHHHSSSHRRSISIGCIEVINIAVTPDQAPGVRRARTRPAAVAIAYPRSGRPRTAPHIAVA